MKSVLISIQPYWVFLIIAKIMGWNIGKEKTVDVRKNYPKDENWNKVAKVYCSKDKKSFSKIPKEYQHLMERLLGKVIGEFVCDKVYLRNCDLHDWDTITLEELSEQSCVGEDDLLKYADRGHLYGWHISDLVIYDEPKPLSAFYKECAGLDNIGMCYECENAVGEECDCAVNGQLHLARPPQSWRYVEEGNDG